MYKRKKNKAHGQVICGWVIRDRTKSMVIDLRSVRQTGQGRNESKVKATQTVHESVTVSARSVEIESNWPWMQMIVTSWLFAWRDWLTVPVKRTPSVQWWPLFENSELDSYRFAVRKWNDKSIIEVNRKTIALRALLKGATAQQTQPVPDSLSRYQKSVMIVLDRVSKSLRHKKQEKKQEWWMMVNSEWSAICKHCSTFEKAEKGWSERMMIGSGRLGRTRARTGQSDVPNKWTTHKKKNNNKEEERSEKSDRDWEANTKCRTKMKEKRYVGRVADEERVVETANS